MIAIVDFEAVPPQVSSDPQCIVIAIRISEDYSSCVRLEY